MNRLWSRLYWRRRPYWGGWVSRWPFYLLPVAPPATPEPAP